MPGATTITILESRLALVRIAREHLESSMSLILDCCWFRPENDPFFALCRNALEVSIFADAHIVRRTFGEYMSDTEEDSDCDSDDEKDDSGEEDEEADSAEEEFAGASGFTLGSSDYTEMQTRERRRRKERGKARTNAEATKPKAEVGQEKIQVGKDVWVALEIAFHGDGWESAGLRVHALSSPLAEAGISLLFLSSYQADFILVKQSALIKVTAILEKSGFQFNAVDSDDEDDDQIIGLDGSLSSLGGLSRQASLRRQQGGSGSNGGSNRGSLAGSLTLSDRGSIGSSKSAPSTMSRSASASRTIAVATAATSSPLASDGLTVSPLPCTPSEISPSATPLPQPSPPPPFSPGTSLSLLPDELVCVGLAQGEPSETLWRTKIVTALFYPERVLPRMEETTWGSATPRRSRRVGEISTDTTRLFPPPANDDRSTSRGSRPMRPPAISRTSTSSSYPASSSSHLSGSICTSLAAPPVPFIALTQTADGTSLTADIRLLRALFPADSAGATGMSEEELVYAVGSGGLRGVWAGEEGESDGEEEGSEVDGASRSRSRGRRAPPPVESESELDSEASEAEEWEHLSRSNSARQSARERLERRQKARMAGEGGRRLLKCLQVDLVAFGLDKFGIVEQIVGILGSEGINCLYQSTYSSANILVSKSDIVRARRVLEEHGKQRAAL